MSCSDAKRAAGSDTWLVSDANPVGNQMRPKIPVFLAISLFLSGCFTNSSEKDFKITPDLAIGNHWLYQLRQFSKAENSVYGDTLVYFIRYEIVGDTVINDSTYQLMTEEDLAIFGSSLEINETMAAVKYESGKVVIKNLKSGGGQLGRYPLKASAQGAFDTVNFDDEVIALSFPIQKNSEWYFRSPGHPKGHGPVKKIFLGVESISSLGSIQTALKFEFIIEDMKWVKSYEWYLEAGKVKSITSLKESDSNNDSIFFEEEYLGSREFSGTDSQTVIDSYRKWSQ